MADHDPIEIGFPTRETHAPETASPTEDEVSAQSDDYAWLASVFGSDDAGDIEQNASSEDVGTPEPASPADATAGSDAPVWDEPAEAVAPYSSPLPIEAVHSDEPQSAPQPASIEDASPDHTEDALTAEPEHTGVETPDGALSPDAATTRAANEVTPLQPDLIEQDEVESEAALAEDADADDQAVSDEPAPPLDDADAGSEPQPQRKGRTAGVREELLGTFSQIYGP